MFAKLADFIHSHSKAIIVVWLAVLICSLPLAMNAGDVLEYDMTNMSGADTEASQGSQIMSDYFIPISMDEIVVVSFSSSAQLASIYDENNPGSTSTFYGNFEKLMKERYPDELAVQYGGIYQKDAESDSGIVLIQIANESSSFDLTHQTGNIRGIVSEARSATPSNSDFEAYVTGTDAISYDTEKSSMEDVSKVDPLSIALIFVLLALFFYAVVTAFVPPAVVGMAYGITLTLIWAIGQFLGIYYITQTLLLVVMLGAGCDYSIFIITRYRDERKKGMDHEHALKEAVMWGGESVATSGISVMIGFAALALCTFSLVQTMGIILALGILVALLAALTFIPSLLNIIGEKLFWPSSIQAYKDADARAVSKEGKKGAHGHLVSFGRRYFNWLSRFTHKHAAPIAVAFILLCIPTTYIYATADDSSDIISIMPDSESIDGLNLIMTQADGGTIMPNYLTLELKDPIADVGPSFKLSGGDVPMGYVIPKSSYAATAEDLSAMASKIQSDYPDIVGSISSLTSWNEIYEQAEQTIVKQVVAVQTGKDVSAVTDEDVQNFVKAMLVQQGVPESAIDSEMIDRATGTIVDSAMKQQIDAAVAKQAVAAQTGKDVSAVTDEDVQNFVKAMLVQQGVPESAIDSDAIVQGTETLVKSAIASVLGIEVSDLNDERLQAFYDAQSASQINHAIQAQMKVASPVGAEVVLTVFNQMSAASGMDAWAIGPEQRLGATESGTPVTMANVMDYYLNVYTGMLATNGSYVTMTIITNEKPMSNGTMDFINDLRKDINDGSDSYLATYSDTFSDAWVSGSSALMNDIGDVVEDQFSFIRIVVIVLLILLLFVILGCYVTPIRAIITIVMSVIWTTALTHIVFEDMLDTPVLFLIPIVLFVVLLGLGMDYEIFLTTKIRENRIKGMDNDTAIDEAVRQAGGVISLCALLMGGTFLTLLLAGSSMLQEFGFALGVGILIDGLFMVGYVSPSLMHLLGEWSWKGPKFLNRSHQVSAPSTGSDGTDSEQ